MINENQTDFGLLHVEERMGFDRYGRPVKARFIKDNRGRIFGIGYTWNYTKLLILFLLKKYGKELLQLEEIK